jgi:formylglycine-generating enzyme required for sulfatase activity
LRLESTRQSTPPQTPSKLLLLKQPFEPEMILISAGEFLMGSDSEQDPNARDDEQPQHRLYLPNYYLAKTPVTNAQYSAFVLATGHTPPSHWIKGQLPNGTHAHPVVWVSWYDGLAYCGWLSEATGKSYGLASEAEWEKGARGTDGRIYPWGNHWDKTRCNAERGFPGSTTPVEAYPQGASPFGVLDIAGNVREWTRSLHSAKYPYNPDDGREDLVASEVFFRALRGGSFKDDHRTNVRCAFRQGGRPDASDGHVGFRVVMHP